MPPSAAPPRRGGRAPALLAVSLASLLAAALAAWAGQASALPAEAPLPPPRPEATPTLPEPPPDPAPAEPEAPSGPFAAAPGIPLPPPRPAEYGPPGPAASSGEPAPPSADAPDAACIRALQDLGAAFEPVPPISNGACGASRPLRLARPAPDVEAVPPATLTCQAALALARWTAEALKPEAGRTMGQALLKIRIGTSYECRTQNRRPGAKLSEHAFANGIDIGGFELAGGRSVPASALAAESPEGRFLQAARTAACAHFTTVLGPGADAAHADHLHLDMRARRGGHRLCQ